MNNIIFIYAVCALLAVHALIELGGFMKAVEDMPTTGQFVAIWFVGDVLFSATLKWLDGQLRSYEHSEDEWLYECDHGYSKEFFQKQNAAFFK